MARNLKLNIKNAQLAEAFKLSSLKTRPKPAEALKEAPSTKLKTKQLEKIEPVEDKASGLNKPASAHSAIQTVTTAAQPADATAVELSKPTSKSSEPKEEKKSASAAHNSSPPPLEKKSPISVASPIRVKESTLARPKIPLDRNRGFSPLAAKNAASPTGLKPEQKKETIQTGSATRSNQAARRPPPKLPPGFKSRDEAIAKEDANQTNVLSVERVRLGPTGRHIDDFLPTKTTEVPQAKEKIVEKSKLPIAESIAPPTAGDSQEEAKGKKGGKGKEVGKLQRKASSLKSIETYLKGGSQERAWRKPRHKSAKAQAAPQSAVPSTLSIRLPISVKDLASEMKLKASQLISQLFMQGMTLTLNDLIEDDTIVAVLGSHFHCEIAIDTSREDRLAITDKSVDQEIAQSNEEDLLIRAPIVTFMGHVDHGKTSLVDAIRQTNRAAHEAGAITQHIGAFTARSAHGPITILDTPGHAAFSEMRARGAKITDLVVLVVAGDEGIMDQTKEVIDQARAAGAILLVAINKSDREAFDVEKVYRQLADANLLPEAWGGTTITVNCSAKTKAGIDDLLEMIGLQAELLELKANPAMRARGVVVEVQMHKGLGPLATVLVQNGTLRKSDSLVFEDEFGRVRNMRDERGEEIVQAGPSTPVAITGLSGLPRAGEQFICVANEKEAREITEGRRLAARTAPKRRVISDATFAPDGAVKKVLNLVVRADVNGSLEAVKTAIGQIHSDKVETNIIADGVGEVSESDVLLAAASKAVVIGFHTQIESHAEILIKQRGVNVQMYDLIYHLVDGVRLLMKGMLDKLKREDKRGAAEIRELFSSSKLGLIAGCIILEGTIHRNHQIRVMRDNQILHRGSIASIKRGKDDVKEVAKGLECGILPEKISDLQAGDILEAIEVSYLTQEL